jgi:hypothetical protein
MGYSGRSHAGHSVHDINGRDDDIYPDPDEDASHRNTQADKEKSACLLMRDPQSIFGPDGSATPFERREIRNHIKESNEALRHYLRLMSEHLQREARTVEDTGDSLVNIDFRILASKSAHHDPR